LTEVFDSGCRLAAVFSHGCAIRTRVSIRARNVDAALDLDHDLQNIEGDRARGLADELVSEVEDKYRLTRGSPLAPDAKACHASSY
jgi:hypothetical protein